MRNTPKIQPISTKIDLIKLGQIKIDKIYYKLAKMDMIGCLMIQPFLSLLTTLLLFVIKTDFTFHFRSDLSLGMSQTKHFPHYQNRRSEGGSSRNSGGTKKTLVQA